MRKFFNKMRYRIACAIAPKNVTVIPDRILDKGVSNQVIDSDIKGVKQGVRMGIGIILGYMKHLNGMSADEWCKEAYDYTEWKMDNLSFSVEKTRTDDGVEVRISVPKDFEDEKGDEDLTPQED